MTDIPLRPNEVSKTEWNSYICTDKDVESGRTDGEDSAKRRVTESYNLLSP